MFCPFCGNEVVATAVVCTRCGSPIKKQGAGDEPSKLVVPGYILGFLFPIVGFILGIVMLTKGTTNHGIGAMVVSILSFFFWMGVMGG